MIESVSKIEASLIGAMVVDPSVTETVAARVKPEDFVTKAYGGVFRELVVRFEAKLANDDPVLLVPALEARGLCGDGLNQITRKELGEMIVGTTASNAVYYADQVVRHSQLRAQQELAHRLLEKAQDPEGDPAAIANWLSGKNDVIAARATMSVRSFGEFAQAAVADIRAAMAAGKPRAFPTSIPSLDVYIGGVAAGELTVIAARPSNGKTAMVSQMLEFNAMRGRRGVLFSLEMAGKEVAQRKLCGLAKVESQRVRQLILAEDEVARMQRQAELVTALPVDMYDGTGTDGCHRRGKVTTRNIRALCKMLQAEKGLDIVAIDYIGLVEPESYRMDRRDQLGQIAEDLKSLAKELNVAVVVLAQLNRSAAEDRPRLEQLAESGKIDNHADIVLLLHNPPRRKQDEDSEIIAAKVRNSGTGSVCVHWDPASTTFSDAALV